MSTLVSIRRLSCLALLSWVAVSFAQQPTQQPAPQPQQPTPQTPGEPVPTIRVASYLVTVPVSVTTARGEPIRTLKPEEFEVLEDDRAQEVMQVGEPGQTPLELALLFDVSGSVDVNVVGDYVLTYSASDPSGNSDSKQRIVHVVDTTAPAIGIPGANSTIECPSSPSFSPPTASDACDANAQVIEVGDETTPGACPGSYVRTKSWKAVDASGNASAIVSQIITIVDTSPPTIGAAGADATISRAPAVWRASRLPLGRRPSGRPSNAPRTPSMKPPRRPNGWLRSSPNSAASSMRSQTERAPFRPGRAISRRASLA